MSDKSTASSAGSSSSSSSSSSPSLASDHIPSSSKEPSFYALQQHDEHVDSSGPIRPLESTNLPPPELSLREPPAPDLLPIVRPTLAQFRVSEGAAARSAKLRALWEALPNLPSLDTDAGPTATQRMKLPGQDTMTALSPERAERLRKLYEEELVRICAQDRPDARLWGGPDEVGEELKTVKGKGIAWQDFRKFLWDKEKELWDIFQDLDRNRDGRLDAQEMRAALSRSGIDLTPITVSDLVRSLATGSSMGAPRRPGSETNEDMYITFAQFRDFLIMLPRKATPLEIYKYYQVHKRFSDGRGAARVDKEGDITVSFPSRSGAAPHTPGGPSRLRPDGSLEEEFADTVDEPAEDEEVVEDRHEAWRFLLAGGVAGAVSRTVTAPFDRLKIYLITTDDISVFSKGPASRNPFAAASTATKHLAAAVQRIYVDGGGLRAFWVGNGLNVTKIFPESAIKFVSYEQTKKFLGKYWDHVSDQSELSSTSRFFAGGVGGITSQFSIYGLETLKTRIQSEIGPAQGWRQVMKTAKDMWRFGGIRSYYRGLTLGLVGVFPYSAIDMGTYETLKGAYCKSTGTDEPPVIAVLSFGALSGSIGAASVYPVNLLRTRLQASGSSGHRHAYTGFVDVLQYTLRNEGWRGLYKGLLPSILKVGPAVGVSWIVYEDMKRRLGV